MRCSRTTCSLKVALGHWLFPMTMMIMLLEQNWSWRNLLKGSIGFISQKTARPQISAHTRYSRVSLSDAASGETGTGLRFGGLKGNTSFIHLPQCKEFPHAVPSRAFFLLC